MDDRDMGPNTEVEVTGTNGATYSAQLCSLPMYDAEGAIVRGKTTTIPDGSQPWRGESQK
jgi:aminomethyltransferase